METDSILSKTFLNKKVVVTGHTGFKGSWLSLWLKQLGAKVTGVSLDIPTKPSLYETSKLQIENDKRLDITDLVHIKDLLLEIKPDFLFHLAAQPIVRKSFSDPLKTWMTNTIGTVNLLESLRNLENECSAIFITSDKCYQNNEWKWGYRENDKLGGDDPYSASKASAEIAIKSYYESYLKKNTNLRIGICRAGNVIGGGDWAQDRLIPDCVRSWINNQNVLIRNPKATRPWQHVLEPISGYLSLAVSLKESDKLSGQAYNFGPSSDNNFSVEQVLKEISKYWEDAKWVLEDKELIENKECLALKLNCDKAYNDLNWKSVLNFHDAIKDTVDWYKFFYFDRKNTSINDYTIMQIERYVNRAKNKGLEWSK